jgi:hypothetical protein
MNVMPYADVSEVMVCAEDVAFFLDKVDEKNAARVREGLHVSHAICLPLSV